MNLCRLYNSHLQLTRLERCFFLNNNTTHIEHYINNNDKTREKVVIEHYMNNNNETSEKVVIEHDINNNDETREKVVTR